MSPEDDRAHRDPAAAPAPSRIGQPGTSGLAYCIHKHLAGQLHYDLRLEVNGALRSWALPKGPSLDPATRRLAIQVEDHPIEYGEFEGVIPEGYGAGIVLLWDYGTWNPEAPDTEASLAAGRLRFSLDGRRLKGSWMLARTRGGDRGHSSGSRHGDEREGRSWLLIKHRDEWASGDDITQSEPRSARSGRTLEDVLAADMPAAWRSGQTPPGTHLGAQLAEVIRRVTGARLEAAEPGRTRGTPASGSGSPPRPGTRPEKKNRI